MTSSYEQFKKRLADVGRHPPCENPDHVMSNYECMTCGKKAYDYVVYTPPVTFDILPMDTAPKDGRSFEVLERREVRWQEYRSYYKKKFGPGRWVTKIGSTWLNYNGNPLGWFGDENKKTQQRKDK